jgi:PAS domain S-box-containing protein
MTDQKREKTNSLALEWERTFNAIEDLVFIQDKDFTITKANKAFADFIGMKAEDIVGKKCYEVIHKSDSPWPGCPFEATLKDKTVHSREIDDKEAGRPLLVTTSPIFDDKGEVAGSVHVAKDITDIRKIEALKDEFVSSVSHDIRNPLSVVKESLNLIMDKRSGSMTPDEKRLYDIARSGLDKLESLVDNILDYQKLSSGRMIFSMTKTDINDIVRGACEDLGPVAGKKAIGLDMRLEEGLPLVNCDSRAINRVIMNLLSNAIKFTDRGSVIAATGKAEGGVMVSVEDTGIGIEQKDIGKLFKSFSMVGTGGREKGTGLGLAISKTIVESHGGWIGVESEYGKGSRFLFFLPQNGPAE